MKIFLGILLICFSTNGMLVKDWGTQTQMKRLIYSTRELFEDSFAFLTAGQNGIYPIPDLMRNYTETWHDISGQVVFLAYNGWIEGLSLNMSGLKNHGNLRRLIMTRAEKSMALKDHNGAEHQHEMIVCDSCISLVAKRIHYAYEVVFHNHESSGILTTDDLSASLSFQLTVASGHNATIGQDYCLTELEPIVLLPTKRTQPSNTTETIFNRLNVKMTNVGVFNFLAEHVDAWLEEHFDKVVNKLIQQKLDVSVRKILNFKNPCERFLTS